MAAPRKVDPAVWTPSENCLELLRAQQRAHKAQIKSFLDGQRAQTDADAKDRSHNRWIILTLLTALLTVIGLKVSGLLQLP